MTQRDGVLVGGQGAVDLGEAAQIGERIGEVVEGRAYSSRQIPRAGISFAISAHPFAVLASGSWRSVLT
jgi:hypothetical protein